MKREAEPYLQSDKKAQLQDLGWETEKAHQPMPIKYPGTATTVRDDSADLALHDAGKKSVLRVKAPKHLLQVRR